jgi:hypothetical protein
MGNTPSQQPFESDAPEGSGSVPDASLSARVAGAVRSFVAAVRRRVTGRSVDDSLDHDDSVPEPSSVGESTTECLPPATPDTTDYRSIEELPARATPFAHPAGDGEDENGPDLQATESGDTLAIYYPNCPGATIESDTWERAER